MLNKIITGDNVAVLKTLENDYIDLTVTSPPYDSMRDYKGYDVDFKKLAKELYRVTKEGGVVVWVVGDKTTKGNESGNSFRQALLFKEVGFNLHDTMIYIKNGGLNSGSLLAYQQKFEYMFVFSKGRPKSINLIRDRKNKHIERRKKNKRLPNGEVVEQIIETPEYGVRYNYWTYNTGKGHSTHDSEAFRHPAIFPEKLAEDHILSWSDKGGVVLDPFGGSGTTAKMAKINGRKYIHIDTSAEYNEIAIDRVESAKEESLLKENQSNIFDFL